MPWTQCHHQKGLVPESSLASEEQELTEIDTLKKQLEKSKGRAGKDECDHSGLYQDDGGFPREGRTQRLSNA